MRRRAPAAAERRIADIASGCDACRGPISRDGNDSSRDGNDGDDGDELAANAWPR
jgi:hypothetical protein